MVYKRENMSSNSDSEKYEICFVQTKSSSAEDIARLRLAYETMEKHDLDPKWVTEEACLKVQKKEAKLFVMDPFLGRIYKHLCLIDCRVVGPMCILSCLQLSETLPRRPHPVYNVSMRKITVTCSNLDKDTRLKLAEKVELMGGNYSKDLTKSVTHLVVGDVGSKKYLVAANFRVPIMLTDWVANVWEDSQNQQVHASDSVYQQYKCPVFRGLSITVSQLSSSERQRYKTLIEQNGGQYSGAMKSKDTTHLVLVEAKGEKYNFAKSWKLHIVKPSWLNDSINSGYCQDERLYMLDESVVVPKKSTPIKDRNNEQFLIDCSAISRVSAGELDETVQSEMSVIVREKQLGSINALEAFDLSTLPKFGQFLDGCKIFLSGFKVAHMEKLRKIINSGGGIRFSNFSESVTHVVYGDSNNQQLFEVIKSSSVKPFVVSLDWLLLCSKNGKLMDETPFTCKDFTAVNLEVNSVAKTETVAPTANQSHGTTTLFSKDITLADDFSEILGQYATVPKTANVNMESLSFSKIEVNDGESENVKLKRNSNMKSPAISKIENIQPAESSQVVVENLFSGRTFNIVGFGDNETDTISNMITAHSGILTPSGRVADIAIVPLIWTDSNISAKNIVTNCWLQKCIEEGMIFQFNENELFAPFDINLSQQPLKNLIISISQYAGTERDCLMHLAEMLGAQCQEYFVKKANPSRGLLPNTHLVAATPEGSKYEASKKWKIPAVNKYWLLAAAKASTPPSIDLYRVGMEPPKDSTFFSEIVHLSERNLTDTNATTAANLNKVPSLDNHNVVIEQAKDSTLFSDIVNFSEKNSTNNMAEDILKTSGSVKKNKVSGSTRCLRAVTETKATPVKIAPNNRVQELIDECKDNSKAVSLQTSPLVLNERDLKAKFDISGIYKALDLTPCSDSSGNGDRKTGKKCLSTRETLSYNLAIGLRNIRGNRNETTDDEDNEEVSIKENTIKEKSPEPAVESIKKGIFHGIVLCVSKKLGSRQLDINRIVHSLGGEYRWTFDKTCTHYVFQGKANDLTKEFREARRLGKIVVSPEWVFACQEAGVRFPEVAYPHTYKPSLSLSQISTSRVATITEKKSRLSTSNKIPKECPSPAVKEEVPVGAVQGENLENVSEQLDQIIVAAKSAIAGKRRTRLNINSSYDSITDGVHRKTSTSSPIYRNLYAAADLKVNDNDNDVPMTEPSQSLPITWDDPTGRLERERIDAANNDDDVTVIDANKADEETRIDEKAIESLPKRFMFTSLTDTEKEHYASIVKELGGEMSSDPNAFDESATHLILGQPIRNEKFLASIATGKWILHRSYLDCSLENNRFLSEELYEWGSDPSLPFMQNLSNSALRNSLCASRWRQKLQSDNEGAFKDWKVTVVANKRKIQSYTKILKAGGAEVFCISSLPVDQKLTHAFVESGENVHLVSKLRHLINEGLDCLKPEYLAFYLIDDPPPPPDKYIAQCVKQYLDSNITLSTSKRRSLSSVNESRKRPRIS